MPAGDRTGPMGAGAMTGRGMGYCAGFSAPGYANPGFSPGPGRGFRGQGRGRGFARGFRGRGFYPNAAANWGYADDTAPPAGQYSDADELAELKFEAAGLSDRLNAITQRIEQLEKDK